MALLWNPESWSQRLAELEAQSGDLKEAPLRRDARSPGTLLGDVLREQAGEELFAQVEALRQGTIRQRDAEGRGGSPPQPEQAEEERISPDVLPRECRWKQGWMMGAVSIERLTHGSARGSG